MEFNKDDSMALFARQTAKELDTASLRLMYKAIREELALRLAKP